MYYLKKKKSNKQTKKIYKLNLLIFQCYSFDSTILERIKSCKDSSSTPGMIINR